MPDRSIKGPTYFEDYSEKYKEFFKMTRRDGIIEVRFHTNDDSFRFGWPAQTAYGHVWSDIGRDPENEVMILTGTGDMWQTADPTIWNLKFMDWPKDQKLSFYHETVRMIENLICCIDIPTVGAINGNGSHWLLGVACDITLCTNDTSFFDPHYMGGIPPGDGIAMALQHIMGVKRAAWYAYTGESISATEALKLGLVNEVLPRADLNDRAWELARTIMMAPRSTRHLTHSIVSRPWKKMLVEDQGFNAAHQLFDMSIDEEGLLERVMKLRSRFQKPEV